MRGSAYDKTEMDGKSATAVEPGNPGLQAAPFKSVKVLKIAGLMLDERLSFQEHFCAEIRAEIRMGVPPRVSGFVWGFGTNVLRMTSNALITSLWRYGLAVTGFMAYEQSLSKVDTVVINVAARRILGVGPSARLPALRSTAGAKSIRNLWFQLCAELSDSSLRVTNGAIQCRLRKWADGIYDAKQWMPMKTQHKSVSMDGSTVYKFKFYYVDVDEQ